MNVFEDPNIVLSYILILLHIFSTSYPSFAWKVIQRILHPIYSSLRGTGASVAVSTVVDGDSVGGLFSVSFTDSNSVSRSTPSLSYDIDASSMKDELEKLDNLASVNVMRSDQNDEDDL